MFLSQIHLKIQEKTIDLIDHHARVTPDNLATIDVASNRYQTYAEMNLRVGKIAQILKDQGVSKGDRVGFYALNTTDILDIIYGYVKLAIKLEQNPKLHGEAFNFGPSSKSNYKVTHVVKIMKKYWGDISWKFKSNKNNFKETNILKLNSNKSKTKLKWKCILSLDETFKMVAEWYQNFYSKKNPSINLTIKKIKNYQILLKNRRS